MYVVFYNKAQIDIKDYNVLCEYIKLFNSNKATILSDITQHGYYYNSSINLAIFDISKINFFYHEFDCIGVFGYSPDSVYPHALNYLIRHIRINNIKNILNSVYSLSAR